jgi:hypothetical protein
MTSPFEETPWDEANRDMEAVDSFPEFTEEEEAELAPKPVSAEDLAAAQAIVNDAIRSTQMRRILFPEEEFLRGWWL